MSRLQSAAGRVPEGWSFGHWPLRRKLAAALALPVILAFIFGGLRVKTDFEAARQLSRAADTVTVIRPVIEYNLAVQKLAAADSLGGGGTIKAIHDYENAAANLRIAVKSENVPPSVRRNAQNALTLGQAVRTAKTQQSFSDVVIDKSGNIATLMSTVVSDLGLSDDSAAAKVVVSLQDAISAQRAMTGQQLNLANTADEAGNLRAIGQVGAETAALTRVQAAAPDTQLGMVRQLLNDNGRRNGTLQQESIEKAQLEGLAPVFESSNTGYASLMNAQLQTLEQNLRDRASSHRTGAIINAGLIGLSLLAALLFVIGLLRSLLTPIRAVRSGALDIANRRLPEAVSAIRDGEEPPAFEPIPVTTHEEMGQLARAVDDLHSQALALAGEQARLRVQVGHMFETLSRRSTSLIDQQLTLIERLESDEEDPKRLQSLFKLDHLAARMRRNSDSLLVLAGTSTRRGVSGAISVSDAVRAAVSEVENYERVDIGDTSNDKVLGAVGSDLIHLLAELVDNALAYSPPTTRVALRGARTPDGGLLIEVTDRGLGMPPKDLAALNDRLANGGDITPDTARRMGLYVVGNLAKRHGIAVRLRRNGDDKQGITVSVHLPAGLLADPGTVADRPRPAASAPETPLAAPAAPTTSAVGGRTKSGLPTRVRGASGTPALAGGPSPVPGAAKKVLPTRTPGAHGPGAADALPAPAKPVIEGAEPAARADTNGHGPNGHEAKQANGHEPVADAPAAEAPDAEVSDADLSAAEARAAEAPAAEVPTNAPETETPAAQEKVEDKPSQESAPVALSPSGLPVRKPRATGITEYREFEDAPSTAPAESADKPAPAKTSRLMSWLPGRAARAAEAARREAEEQEPRPMPSNLSAWLDHRAKLVEAQKARAKGAEPQATEAESANPEPQPAETPAQPEATEQVEPAAVVEPDVAPVEPETVTAEASTAEVSSDTELHVPDEWVAETASSDAAPAPERRPGRPAVRAHNSSFFGARRRRPAEPERVEEDTADEPVAQPTEPVDEVPVAQAEHSVEQAKPEQQVAEAAPAVEQAEPEQPVAEAAPAVEQAEPEQPVAQVDAVAQGPEPVAQPEVAPQPEAAPQAERAPASLDDTPIFRAMMSRWLTDEPTAGDAPWAPSEIDQAWSAAAEVAEAEPLEESSSGLPKRRPGNRLIPGLGDEPAAAPTPTGSRRDPETIRRNLNRHQQGVSAARTEAQDGTHREEADVHH